MIIRKKGTTSNNDKPQNSAPAVKKSSSIVKKGSLIKKEEQILDVEAAKNTESNLNREIKKPPEPVDELEEFGKIDISSIEFKERVERRRGERRRGYRRIDERSLVSRAQQEAHTIKELASREGYQQGLKKAQEEVEKLTSAISEFLSLRDEMYEEFYPHVMEISLAIAKKIIKKEVEMSPDVLKNVIMETLEELNSDAQKVEIKVNSDDVELAKKSLPELIASYGSSVRMMVTGDDTVEKGSCVIIANNGVIDANFRTQLNVLQNAFGIYKGGA